MTSEGIDAFPIVGDEYRFSLEFLRSALTGKEGRAGAFNVIPRNRCQRFRDHSGLHQHPSLLAPRAPEGLVSCVVHAGARPVSWKEWPLRSLEMFLGQMGR